MFGCVLLLSEMAIVIMNMSFFYEDNSLCVSYDPEYVISQISDKMKFKKNKVVLPEFNSGARLAKKELNGDINELFSVNCLSLFHYFEIRNYENIKLSFWSVGGFSNF